MILVALLLALLQPEDSDTPFSDRQPVRVEPLSAERALTAFEQICVAGFPDPESFDRAAASADLDLVRREKPQRGAREWSSAHGHFVLRQASGRETLERRDRREGRASRQRWVIRCDFWSSLPADADVTVLFRLISERLASGRAPREEIFGHSWNLSDATPGETRKLLFLPSIDDPRLFTLSLQQLADNSAG